MEPSSDPPKKPDGGDDEGDQCDRKPSPSPPELDSMTDVDRTNALKSHRIRYEDAIDPNAERVTDIQPRDVLLGRGKRLQDREGNVRMRQIAQKYSASYHYLKPSEKKSLIESVYHEIIQDGARFLIKGSSSNNEDDDDDDDGDDEDDKEFYLVVDKEVALQKISNILRRKKPIVETRAGPADIGQGTSLDPAMYQAMIAGRGNVENMNIPLVASMNLPAMTGLGNEVARLPTNPLFPPLDSLASLPYGSLYNRLPSLATSPSEQMRMQIMANMAERDRMVRDVLTIQQLNALQESRAAAIYSQVLNRSAVYPPVASTAATAQPQHPLARSNNEEDDEGGEAQDEV